MGETEDQEMIRIHGLEDRWLSEQLLRLARTIRVNLAGEEASPTSCTRVAELTWHLLPELARRLGSTSLLANESMRTGIRSATPDGLRSIVGQHVMGGDILSRDHGFKGTALVAARLLGRMPEIGNPMVVALDRVAPPPSPGGDLEDWLARRMTNACRSARRTLITAWQPSREQARKHMNQGANILRPDFGHRKNGIDQ